MALSKSLTIGIGAVLSVVILIVVAVAFIAVQLMGSVSDLATSVPPETIGDWIDQILALVGSDD